MASNRKFKNGMWKDDSKQQERVSSDLFLKLQELLGRDFQGMNKNMKKIRRLAKKKGTPLTTVDFHGKAVSFVYGNKAYWYPNLTKGIRRELERLG